MKIRELVLKNFRSYKGYHRISISNFTTVVGKNDAGKSTLLEALDIFFGGGTKIDKDDLSRGADDSEIRIGVVFSDFQDELTIDRGSVTSLSSEYLLNKEDLLEVHKSYNAGASRITPKVFARAMSPKNEEVSDLIQLKNSELKKKVKDLDLEARCELNNNPSMRRALYDSFNARADLEEKSVALSEGDAAGIWKTLEKYLPIYTLFKSDRVSTDQDPEAQNPMKAAVSRAVAELSEELDGMTKKVREMVEETANRTIKQMQESFPGINLARELTPKFQDPKWSSIFKIDLAGDDDIPLNKRGSGVRRLILLSFFQSEANRRREEEEDTKQYKVPIIYAVEEPETSQHPDNQGKIIEALQGVVETGDQVIITTHNPNLAELLPIESIRFVSEDRSDGGVVVQTPNEEVLKEVVETLGVLPASVPQLGIKVAVLTEGKTDIDAIMNFYEVLVEAGRIDEIDMSKVFWAIGGGNTVKDWIERRYLERLNIPQIIIVDSDRDGPLAPRSKKMGELQDLVADIDDAVLFFTNKREIENYLHPEVLHRETNGTLELGDHVSWDYDRIPSRLGEAIVEARKVRRIEFEPVTREGEKINMLKAEKNNCKKMITSYLFAKMTAEEIEQRGASEGGANEVGEWLEKIREHVR